MCVEVFTCLFVCLLVEYYAVRMTNASETGISAADLQTITSVKFDATFLPVVAASFVGFQVLYKFVNPVLSDALVAKYRTLTVAQRIEWSTR